MKCIVLAGGSGDRLWPISRRKYPKQFIAIKNDKSMFQEAILRNMAFCDEFVIVTNCAYEQIARNQLSYFHGLKYSFILEPVPLKTAVSLIKAAQRFDINEDIIICSVDHMIEGDYNSSIIRAKELITDNKIVALCVEPTNHNDGYHYFKITKNKLNFTNEFDVDSKWDCGIFISKVSTFLSAVDKDYLDLCRSVNIVDNVLICPDEYKIAKRNNEVLQPKYFYPLECDFKWKRLLDLNDYYEVADNKANNISLIEKSNNANIINLENGKLIVANCVSNLMIVNTKDTLYISSKDSIQENKTIGKSNLIDNKYFEIPSHEFYRWGEIELIESKSSGRIIRITIYPFQNFEFVYQPFYIYNFIVLEGELALNSSSNNCNFEKNDSFSIKDGLESYKFVNQSFKKALLLQVSNRIEVESETKTSSSFVKLRPTFKEFLWGGDKMKTYLGKETNGLDMVAESWELSAHKAGQSVVDSGLYKGMAFGEFVKTVARNKLGWKALNYEEFPLMIKFIDAKRDLSIQVHPNDDYALLHEKDYGKNEMRYIMQADNDAFIYLGFSKDITKDEIKERIKNGTLSEVLNKIKVKKGEAYFIPAGTVHAIGAGCFICEIQQSSNVTYRLYDYGRLDKDGNPRELHIEKSLDVLNLKKYTLPDQVNELENDEILAECKYFSVKKYVVNEELDLPANDSTFKAIVIIDGKGKIDNGKDELHVYRGDTLFCGCKESITIKGNMTLLVSSL